MAQTKVKLISDGVIVQGNLHASHGITTAHIGEGSNLYYTDARVGSYLSSNGYATQTNIVAAITDSAPSTLDTLNELAAALGDDVNFSTTVTNSIALKAPIASPSFTGNATFAENVTIGDNKSIISNGSVRIDIDNDNNSTTRAFVVRNNGGANTLFRVQEDGYVGIGEDSPQENLHITATTPVFRLEGGSHSYQQYVSGTSFYIRDVTNSSNRIVLDGSGNSTFAGNITGVRGFFNSGATNVVATFTSTDGIATLQCTDPVGNVEFGASGNNFVVQPAGGVAQLTVGTSSSTFAGNVALTTGSQLFFDNGNTYISEDIADRLRFFVGGSEFMRFTEDTSDNINFYHNATFVGDVDVNGGQLKIQGDFAKLLFEDTAGTDLDSYIVNNANGLFFGKTNSPTTSNDILSLNLSTKSATFAGNVGIGGNASTTHTLDLNSSSNLALRFFDSTTFKAGMQAVDTGGQMIATSAAGDFAIRSQSNMLFSTGGNTERMRIDSSGNVGIGTDSPSTQIHNLQKTNNRAGGFYTQLQGNAYGLSMFVNSGGYGIIGSNGTFTTDVLTMDLNSGNVGIGTSSPDVKLEITTLRESGIRLSSSDITAAVDELLSGIDFYSPDSGNEGIKASIKVNYADTAANSYMTFSTGANTESMRITSGGKVILGTDSSNALEINSTGDTEIGFSYQAQGNIYAKIIGDITTASPLGGELAFQTATGGTLTERMRIDSGGSIHQNYISGLAGTSDYGFTIAKQTGYSQIYFRADTTSTRYIQRFYNDNSGTLQNVGNIIISGSSTSYATSSDYRLKENVVEMTGALDRVSQLKPSRFNFIADADKTVDGFLAHEVQEIVPEAITGEKDAVDEEGNPEYQGIDQSKLVPLLVGAIQELKADNDSLKARIETLENN